MKRFAALLLAALSVPAFAQGEAATLYTVHCAACHGAGRLGGTGPALLPENLERLRRPAAAEVIAKGRHATQMPGFADKLSDSEIGQLADLIYTRPAAVPAWGMEQIRASQVIHPAARPEAARA